MLKHKFWYRQMVVEQYAACVAEMAAARQATRLFLEGADWPRRKIDVALENADAAGYGYEILEKRNRVLRALGDARLQAFCPSPEAWVLMRLSRMLAPTEHLRLCWESLTPENQRVARWVCAVRELRVPDEWPDMRLLLEHLQAGRVILAQWRAARVEVRVVGNA